ncbi:hypothetical protein CspeluHIS016_0601570 [Cutaneotrichosporon spelunceum]|uniref:HCNGP-domain-containing protein n=1 Tax=Cutaneotrichosporon spelunceum TaxID=1672016 RepID=A0AAD3YD16_9TREE|nr:hypothetical protein CspeluHIS016_0601570 [Cutaneotrichosporon spelunceum]
MQALANYADDSPSPTGPSRFRLPRRTATPSPPSRQSPSGRAQSASPVTDSRAPTSRAPTSRAPSPSEDEFEGMSDGEIFRLVTRSGDESEWRLPPEVDPTTADSRLQAKVSQFLRLKQQGQHINTSLMQSSSFANPTIYTKLVEFVDIDERASAFPGGGWLTRRGLEGQIPTFGPKALQVRQNAMDAANKRAQEGKRREIAFTRSGRGERESDRDERRRGDRDRDRGRDRREKGGVHRPKYGWEGGRRERDPLQQRG